MRWLPHCLSSYTCSCESFRFEEAPSPALWNSPKKRIVASALCSLGLSGISLLVLLFAEHALVPMGILAEAYEDFSTMWNGAEEAGYSWVCLSTVAIGPIFEEVLFRGLVYSVAERGVWRIRTGDFVERPFRPLAWAACADDLCDGRRRGAGAGVHEDEESPLPHPPPYADQPLQHLAAAMHIRGPFSASRHPPAGLHRLGVHSGACAKNTRLGRKERTCSQSLFSSAFCDPDGSA